jgi:hypothetical protein
MWYLTGIFFTKHGMYMNVNGKRATARKIIEAIPSILDKYELYKSILLSRKNAPTEANG